MPEHRRAVTYCILPADLAGRLHEPLRRHFAADASVEVVIEQRWRDRRRLGERRVVPGAAEEERRRIRAADGRRVADRRATFITIDPSGELPRKARPHADRLVFIERLAPSTEQLEDCDTARLVARFQAGDHDLFAELYLRYFDRIYRYLRVVLKDDHEAEDATQQVFTQVFEALPGYERRRQPFRAWLFVIARNGALDQLKRQGRVAVTDPAELYEGDGPTATDESDVTALRWLTDRELLMLIERLPLAQRKVVVLRFMLDMSINEVAEIMGVSTNQASVLQYRALGFLRQRLSALGRDPKGGRQVTAKRRFQQAPVLRWRRFALTP